MNNKEVQCQCDFSREAINDNKSVSLVELINEFRAIWPVAHGKLFGCSHDEFTREVVALSLIAGGDKLADYHAAKKEVLTPVVDAVNYCETSNIKVNSDDVVMLSKRCGLYVTQGWKLNIHNDTLICTYGEYNQCIKELSEAAWMNDGEPMYYDIYKLAYRDMQEHCIGWQFGDLCTVCGCDGFTFISKNPLLDNVAIVSRGFCTINISMSDLAEPGDKEVVKFKN